MTPPLTPDAPWLAPLAGYSDLAFRLLCRDYGAACAVTEMVSAKGMVYHSPGTAELLATTPEDAPLVVQLFGSEPEMIARAMDMLLQAGFAHFDLNAGCPVNKVVKTGAGAALLKTPELLAEIASVMVGRAGPGRVGVKIRAGWQDDSLNYLDVGRRLEDAGVAWLTLHPRHARQGYSGTAPWERLAEFKRTVGVPVVASGDLFTARDARDCLARTGVDAVMFARGALYDPTIFKQYLDSSPQKPPSGDAVACLASRHAELMRAHGRPDAALRRMRSIVPRYVRGLAGARALRMEMTSCTTWDRFDAILDRIRQAGPAPGPERFKEQWDESS
ncbi:hypothetical protein JCM15519_04850 [Fundidesulfovibrio butyratiphilus]